MLGMKTTQILFLCCLSIPCSPLSEEGVCNCTFDKLNQVEWPSTIDKTLSNPPCAGENKEFIYRECSNGKWSAEPSCYYIQPGTIPSCPTGYIETGNICYALSPISTFPPKCPSNDVLSFESYELLIPSENTVPFWMPVRRDSSSGVGLLRWTEATSKYNTRFTNSIGRGVAKGHDCVIYHSEEDLEAVSCLEVHPGMCVYKKWSQTVKNDLCTELGPCVQTNFFDRSKCTCLGNGTMKEPLAEFQNVEENKVYTALTSENCTIGLVHTNGTYVWKNSKREISYTFWSKEATFDETLLYGASTESGWILTQSPLPCFLYETKVPNQEPSMSLELIGNSFVLLVNNYKRLKRGDGNSTLISCFTNADAAELVTVISGASQYIINDTVVAVKFEIYSDDSALYWCEGFRFTDMEVVRGEFFFESANHEFVARFGVTELPDDSVSVSTLEYIQNTLFILFQDDPSLDSFRARLMKLEYTIDYQLVVNIHFTSLSDVQNPDEEDEWKSLSTSLKYILDSGTLTKLIGVRSVNFCFEEFDGKLNWPKTPVSKDATPDEFCMTKYGSRVTRNCYGDFIDGAQWSNYDECEIFQSSYISDVLQDLGDNSIGSMGTIVYDISGFYEDFTPLDVNLVAEAFRLHLDTSSGDMVLLANTTNNLLNIDKRVLKEAQQKMTATGKLLNVLHNVMVGHVGSYDVGLSNFAFMSLDAANLTGLIVFEDNSLRKMTRDYTVQEVISVGNVKSAIWLDPERHETVAITAFYNDGFFQEQKPEFDNVSTIFGLAFPNSDPTLQGSVKVLHKIENSDEEECVSWNQASWVKNGTKKYYSKFVLCEYYQPAYFALVYNSYVGKNVTVDLIDALGSTDSSPPMVSLLYRISRRYDQFEWVDISYVGQILEQVTYEDQTNLEDLTKTVSNLHNVDRDVLIQSQLRDKSTDMILASVDNIIQKYDNGSVVQYQDEHFMVLIIDTKKITFNGVALLTNKQSFEIEMLTSDAPIADVLKYDNFHSVLYLNTKLRDQVNNSKIIITIFNSDALFNENNASRSKDVSKVFGVILPEIGNYSGPVTVLHKVDTQQYSGQCVHWNYSTESNYTGFWNTENGSQNHYGLIQCDYWHTTHFALLILARDNKSAVQIIESLDIITTVNTIISLICLTCVVLTALLFEKWRCNTGNQILLNFSIVVIIQLVIFYISGSIPNHLKNYFWCTFIGAILHYSTISQFCWMLVVAVLQYWRYVLVLKAPPSNILLKSCLFGWLAPLVPVISVIVSDECNYVTSKVGLCYPSEWGLYLGVWLPVGVIIIVNCIIFLIILYNITYRRRKFTDIDRKEMIYQWRLGVLLFSVLGLTWVFGFLANFHENQMIFVYLFCTTATLEGFTIFVFFILCNPDTRYLYWRAVKKYSMSLNK